jgi:outer membrane protein TolC
MSRKASIRGTLWARATIVVLIAATSSLSVPAEDANNVVTLTQCIDAALKNGPDVKLSQTNLSLSQAQYSQALAQSSFSLSGNAGVSRAQPIVDTRSQNTTATDAVQGGLSFSGPSTRVNLSASYNLAEQSTLDHSTKISLSASQTIWDGYAGGQASAAAEQAGLTLQGKQSADDANRKNIIYNVKQAYYTMIAQQRQLKVLQDTLTQRQQELKRVQTLFETRNATRIDLKQAQVNQTQADLDLKSARSTLEVNRERLSNLVGWAADTIYSAAEVDDQPAPGLDVAEAVKTALSRRVDFKQLQLNKASGDITIALKKAQYSPTASATGSLSWTQDLTENQALADYSIGLQVTIPIFDSGLTGIQVRQAQLQNEAIDIQAAQTAANIATDVKNALYSLRDLLARADLAQSSLDLAKDQYELAKAQFDTGVISTLDLLTASVALTTAEVGLARARSNTQLGMLALQNAMGY